MSNPTEPKLVSNCCGARYFLDCDYAGADETWPTCIGCGKYCDRVSLVQDVKRPTPEESAEPPELTGPLPDALKTFIADIKRKAEEREYQRGREDAILGKEFKQGIKEQARAEERKRITGDLRIELSKMSLVPHKHGDDKVCCGIALGRNDQIYKTLALIYRLTNEPEA